MDKKKKIVIFLFVFLLTGLVFWQIKRRRASDFGVNDKSSSSSGEERKKYDYQWVDWEDPAGFSFQYPEEVKIDNHPEDEESYAYLTLSHSDHSGGIKVICNDSQYEDLDDWLENDEEIKEVNSLETEIASISGRKLALGEGKEMTAFIDLDDVFYTVEIEAKDKDYWQPVYKQILNSFKFIPLEGETQAQFEDWLGGFDTAGADVIEPVEVIQ